MNLGKGKKKSACPYSYMKIILRPLENQLHRKVETCVESPKASSWNGFECVQIMISGETPGSQLGSVIYTIFSQELQYFHLCIYVQHIRCLHQHVH